MTIICHRCGEKVHESQLWTLRLKTKPEGSRTTDAANVFSYADRVCQDCWAASKTVKSRKKKRSK